VCDPEGELGAFERLDSLLEKSLLRQEEGPGGEPRFVMLETIHEFARKSLQESGEAEKVRRLHAEFFLALSEEAEPELTGGPDQVTWSERLEAEHDNIRAALSWSLEVGDIQLTLRLAGALTDFCASRSRRAYPVPVRKGPRATLSRPSRQASRRCPSRRLVPPYKLAHPLQAKPATPDPGARRRVRL
jgi:hypothetical protein